MASGTRCEEHFGHRKVVDEGKDSAEQIGGMDLLWNWTCGARKFISWRLKK